MTLTLDYFLRPLSIIYNERRVKASSISVKLNKIYQMITKSIYQIK